MTVLSEHDGGKLVTITRARFEQLQYAERQLSHLEGTCMCGDAVDAHGYGSGHSPVSFASYFRPTCANQAELPLE